MSIDWNWREKKGVGATVVLLQLISDKFDFKTVSKDSIEYVLMAVNNVFSSSSIFKPCEQIIISPFPSRYFYFETL